jgi:hypothetical protein
MRNRLFAIALLVATMTMLMLPTSIANAAPIPPSLHFCVKNGKTYSNGALYKLAVYFNNVFIRYDVYRCTNGA